jgi:Permuted papain-like amidase enzyme, YaeF/YiiX, C92 family
MSLGFYSSGSHLAKWESTPVIKYIDPSAMISEGQMLLKEGDLVVRLNQDPASQFIKNFNRHDKNYSHAGIVLYENGHPYIYHIVNGEENPDEKLRKDSLSRFCNPRKNMGYGIFRYDMTAGEIKRLKDLIHQWYAKGVQFDPAFNLKTNDKMYCSEMISKALAKATRNRILIATTKPTIAEAGLLSAYMHLTFSYTSQLRIVPIDNLYTNTHCYLIKDYNYKK